MVRETSVDFLRIDLSKGNIRKVITACQNDSIRRTIHFVVVNNGVPLDLSNLFYAEILIQRVDGTEVDNPLIIDGADICYTLKSTDIAVLGENVGHLMLTFNDGSTVETPEFYLNVFNKFYNPTALQSQNDYGTIVQMALDASNSAQDAATSATDALNSANAAASSADDADESADEAKESELAAKGYAEAAEASATSAEASASTATDKAEEAGTYATNALASKNAAVTSASNAASSESNAAASATTAIEAASTATEKAEEIVEAAETATTKASEASDSADEARAAENSAKGYSQAAATSATSAGQSASTATTKASDAAESESNALDYKNAAASSATSAGTSATTASNAADNALIASSTATNKAAEALTSANTASTKASEASGSAAAAAESAAKAEEAYEKMGGETLVLGETSTTAYRGDRGKTAYDHSQTTGNPHNTTAVQVGADPAGSAAAAYQQAAAYVDAAIAALINGAPQTLDTLKEIADAMAASATVVEALQQAIGTKANETDFEGHRNNTTVHITAQERTLWNGITALAGRVTDAEGDISDLQTDMLDKTDDSDFTAHTGNTTVHITAQERALWNGITALTARVAALEGNIGYPINTISS